MTSIASTLPDSSVEFRAAPMIWGQLGPVEERRRRGAATASAPPEESSKSHPTMVHRPRALPKSTSIRDPEVRGSRLLISGSGVRVPDGAPDVGAPRSSRPGGFVVTQKSEAGEEVGDRDIEVLRQGLHFVCLPGRTPAKLGEDGAPARADDGGDLVGLDATCCHQRLHGGRDVVIDCGVCWKLMCGAHESMLARPRRKVDSWILVRCLQVPFSALRCRHEHSSKVGGCSAPR